MEGQGLAGGRGGDERGRKRGERRKGGGVFGSRARELERREGRKGWKGKYDPRTKEALSRSGDLGKKGRKWNGREEDKLKRENLKTFLRATFVSGSNPTPSLMGNVKSSSHKTHLQKHTIY